MSNIIVRNEIILPDDLKNARFSTNTITNEIELQTLEKAFVRYPATSQDDSSLTWNVPSISGGQCIRELEHEIPICFDITWQREAQFAGIAFNVGTPIPDGTSILACVLPTRARPFCLEHGFLDQFPLSKIFKTRDFQINNASRQLQEVLDPEQIDIMVAGLDWHRMHDFSLDPFCDANAHFRPLDQMLGGNFVCQVFHDNVTPGVPRYWLLEAAQTVSQGPFAENLASVIIPMVLGTPKSIYAENVKENMATKRNTARNIVKREVKFYDTTNTLISNVGTSVGYGDNLLPLQADGFPMMTQAGAFTARFCFTVREQLISQYWDSELSHSEFQWNRLLPASSLNIRYGFNSKYMGEALLKIGDFVGDLYGGSYTVSNVRIASQFDQYYSRVPALFLRQCKIPTPLNPRSSWKMTYYHQTKPQASKDLSAVVNGASRSFSATMQYANLSLVSEYLAFVLPIDKPSYLTALKAYDEALYATNTNAYQLPSTLNLPITRLNLTFNQDSNLGTYNMDYYTLQKLTMKNLQNLRETRKVVQGESTCGVAPILSQFNANNNTGGDLVNPSDGKDDELIKQIYAQNNHLYPWTDNLIKFSPISNSSFVLLKVGTDIRLPDGISPGMVLNYNLEVSVESDLTLLNNLFADVRSSVGHFIGMDAPVFSAIRGKLDVIHYTKNILDISGTGMQNVYIKDVQIDSLQYVSLVNDYQANFGSRIEEGNFNTKMMIGGGSWWSSLRDKASAAFDRLKSLARPVLETARKGVDYAKENLAKDSALRNYVDMADQGLQTVGYAKRGGMDSHAVAEGKKKRGGKDEVDWRGYLDNVRP